jgi:hypothetical protein
MEFKFDSVKNDLLRKTRGVTFPMVIEAVAERGILLDFPHPNQAKYPMQRVFVVDLEGYAYCVPYRLDGDIWHLKTIYPSRKFKYLVEGGQNGQV